MTTHIPEFGRLRAFLWPIKGSELKKFLPMCIMMFFMIFNYTVLRNTKDSFVVTLAGAEVIPFLKGGIVMPFSILFVAVYARVANALSRERLFYVTLGFFLVFFLIFVLVLYPNRDFIQPSHETIQSLKESYPTLQHIFPIFGKWIYMAFYVFAELWGNVIINLLFWQFANEITRLQEASRFYAMFGFIGHGALIAGGFAVKESCDLASGAVDDCGSYLNYAMGLVILSGSIILMIYRWMTREVLSNPQYYDEATAVGRTIKEKKTRLSLMESLRYICSSKYLGLIAILVFSYAFTQNLLGLIWKKQLALQFPNPLEYGHFMGNFSVLNGILTVMIIFFCKGIVRRFGWFKTSMLTPMIVMLTTIALFMFIFFRDTLSPFAATMGTTTLMLAVLVSSAQQILIKSAKYSLFDPTKEMVYIPLDDELKVKGKAAVDVTVYQFGKASGGYLIGGLLVIFQVADLMMISPVIAVIVFTTMIAWTIAVKSLNGEYASAVQKQSENRVVLS